MQKQEWFKKVACNLNKKTAYINTRILDPKSGLDIHGQLITEGEKIKDFGENILNNVDLDSAFDEVIDCEGHLLTPGLVDIHVHFREPGFMQKETIETGSKSAAAGGLTTVVCQPNTKPRISTPMILQWVLSRPAYINIESYASISTEEGHITEMELLKEAGAVGFTDDGITVMNSGLMQQALLYSKKLKLPIAQHAEDLSITGHMNEGETSSSLSVKGAPNICESIIVDRDIKLSEYTGGYYHVLHISTKEALQSVRAAKVMGLNVTCEVAPHHFTLTDKALRNHNALAKVNPPLRSEEDRLAMIEGLRSGLIDCIASDHAPHEYTSKNLPIEDASFGLVGVETILPLSMALYHKGILSLSDTVGKLTYQAAQIINKPVGTIEKGKQADLTLIDLDEEWIIETAKFSSKSKNAPYDGIRVKSRAIRTIVKGQTVYIYGSKTSTTN